MDLTLEFDSYIKFAFFVVSIILLIIAPTLCFSFMKKLTKLNDAILPLSLFLFNFFCILEFFLLNKLDINIFNFMVALIFLLIILISEIVIISNYKNIILSLAIAVILIPSIYIAKQSITAIEIISIPIVLFYLYLIILSIIKLGNSKTRIQKREYFLLALIITISIPTKILLFLMYDDGSASLVLLVLINLFLYSFYLMQKKIKTKDKNYQLKEYNLTNREIEVVLLLLQGLNNLEISEKLYISENTIKRHIYNIYRKMSISTRFELFSKLQL